MPSAKLTRNQGPNWLKSVSYICHREAGVASRWLFYSQSSVNERRINQDDAHVCRGITYFGLGAVLARTAYLGKDQMDRDGAKNGPSHLLF